MEVNDRKPQIPNLALPPPPRFDAAATAAARRVKPLPKSRLSSWLELEPTIRDHSKVLIGIALVSLATGAAGGMFIKDRQHQFITASVVPLIESDNLESATPLNNQEVPASLEPSAEPVQPQPTRRPRPRRVPRREVVVLEDEDEEDEDEEKDKDKDKDDDRRKERDRDRSRKDRDRHAEYDRNHRSRPAVLYDVVRTRRP